MKNMEELTLDFIQYMSWVGENPEVNAFDSDKMMEITHEQFILTYFAKVIVKGLENHALHFIDGYKQLGKWQHEVVSIQSLNDISALAHYVVKTEKKPATPCKVIFIFLEQKCIGMHEVEVDLTGILEVDENFIRTDESS